MEDDEESWRVEFFETYSDTYGYEGKIDAIRENEFERLGDELYLDHIGATQYSKSLIDDYSNDLRNNIYGNPHSQNSSSQLTTERINEIRNKILEHFHTNCEEYSVVFTSGATAAMKIVANCFDWQKKSCLVYLQNSHTSVVGIRECAVKDGASFCCLKDADFESYFDRENQSPNGCSSLCIYPAMCNMSGKKYPLEWVTKLHDLDNNWFVMVDAASYVSTSHLDLSKNKADFVPLSFYKMFGFPTGIGALLIRNKSVDVLKKVYYGGGTVMATISGEKFHVLRPNISGRFEDGTLPFLDIIAVGHALENLNNLTGGMKAICQHTFTLAQFVFNKMSSMKHFNGVSVCKLYCGTEFSSANDQGPVINFNIRRSSGEMVGYGEVDKFACLFNIHLRTGSFCNTGASQQFLGISNLQLKNNYLAGHVCGDKMDLIEGQPTGSVRISFGYMSTFEDAKKFLKFVRHCFIEREKHVAVQVNTKGPDVDELNHENLQKQPINGILEDINDRNKQEVCLSSRCCTLKNICLFPIKSCSGFKVTRWKIGPRGLKYDRKWMIINESHICLSQKRESKLCLIQPSIDETRNVIIVNAPDMPTLEVNIINYSELSENVCRAKINLEKLDVFDCGDEAATWLTSFLGKRCRLVQQRPQDERKSKVLSSGCKESPGQSSLSLANVSQYLLISEASVLELHKNMHQPVDCKDTSIIDVDNLVSRFRGNLVINGDKPFEEDTWKVLLIGHHSFQFHGLCSRCQMICLDQKTGKRNSEPLKTLGVVRQTKVGTFGIGLVHDESICTGCNNDVLQQQYLNVGDMVQILQ